MLVSQSQFLSLFLREELVLRCFLLAATGDPHEAEDLLQSVARVLWEKFDRYDQTRPFRPWALGVARTEVLKWKQGKARSPVLLSDDAVSCLADTAVERAERLSAVGELLRTCLAKLKDAARRAVDLKYGGGLTIREIAVRIGKSVAAVEMILVRARRFLRTCVERQMGSGEHK